MDFTLRCNSLKCRTQLTERAVVTTCSHVFCVKCSDTLGLSNTSGHERVCPACRSPLLNADDAVFTTLNPSEDYKTSVLSGLSPTIIMECAGRGLAFFGYQTSQEIVYQEHLAKGLAGKHNSLSTQMDQIIHEANAEIVNLRNKISALENDQHTLQRKNENLREAYSEKVRQYQKCQTNYDKMRRRVLDSDVQLAAEDALEDTLSRKNDIRAYSGPQRLSIIPGGIEQVHRRQKSGSSGHDETLFISSQTPQAETVTQAWHKPAPSNTTPCSHRTRLPVATAQTGWGSRSTDVRRAFVPNISNTRQPLGTLNSNSNRHLSLNTANKFGRNHPLQPRQREY